MNKTEIIKVKTLSHNVNTPLTTILGYISLIKTKSPDEDVKKWLNTIKKEVLKISRYTKKINDIISKNCP